MSEWIKVSERLPEPGLSQMRDGLFLAVNAGHVQPMCFVWKSKRWISTPSGYDLTEQVSHWQYLPSPPEDTDND